MSFTRRHLPHWIPDNSIIFVTWRVAEGSPLADPRCAQVVADALMLGRTGSFWQDESFDHWIRNGREMEGLIAYVEGNPLAAGLKNWPWSSKIVN